MQIKKLFQFFFFMAPATMLWGENYSLSFDGDDDYVHINNSSSINVDNNISIGFWMKPNAWTDGD